MLFMVVCRQEQAVVVCSALKAKYRAKLRGGSGTGAVALVSNNISLRELFGV